MVSISPATVRCKVQGRPAVLQRAQAVKCAGLGTECDDAHTLPARTGCQPEGPSGDVRCVLTDVEDHKQRLRESAGRLQEGHLRSREALHTLSACVTAFLSSFIKWRALSSSLAAAASYRLRLWPAPIALAGEARQTGTTGLDL